MQRTPALLLRGQVMGHGNGAPTTCFYHGNLRHDASVSLPIKLLCMTKGPCCLPPPLSEKLADMRPALHLCSSWHPRLMSVVLAGFCILPRLGGGVQQADGVSPTALAYPSHQMGLGWEELAVWHGRILEFAVACHTLTPPFPPRPPKSKCS